MEQVHEACTSLRKNKNKTQTQNKGMEEAKINLTFNYFWGVIGSRCSRKHSGGKWMEIKTLEHFSYSTVLGFFAELTQFKK